MVTWQCVLLGAAGGALVEVLAVLSYLMAWQRARRTRSGLVRRSPPRWASYVDVPAHLCVLVVRAPLGAATAWLFATTGQISGPYAALAFGFAAPAILAQLGRLPQVDQALQRNTRDESSTATEASPPSSPAARPAAVPEPEVEQL
jgi:hypothetical protein